MCASCIVIEPRAARISLTPVSSRWMAPRVTPERPSTPRRTERRTPGRCGHGRVRRRRRAWRGRRLRERGVQRAHEAMRDGALLQGRSRRVGRRDVRGGRRRRELLSVAPAADADHASSRDQAGPRRVPLRASSGVTSTNCRIGTAGKSSPARRRRRGRGRAPRGPDAYASLYRQSHDPSKRTSEKSPRSSACGRMKKQRVKLSSATCKSSVS